MKSSKKEARLENKKRKLEALVKISKLNESDNEQKRKKMELTEETSKVNKEIDLGEPLVKRSKSNDSATKADESERGSVLSDEDYAQLKRELKHKKRELKNVPKLRMKLFGDNALLTIPSPNRTPILFTDIQHLIMYGLFGSSSPCVPTRWCHLEKVNKISHTVVVVIDGLSLYHFSSHESLLKSAQQIFEHKLEVVMPGKSSDEMVNEIMMVPLTNIFRDDLIEKYVSDSENNDGKSTTATAKNDTEVFSRTQLLLSALQMIDEGYPLPLRGELANRYKEFVMTKDKYEAVTAQSPMFGVDCEMCRTSVGVNELTRISIIDENHESIYETLVCPRNKIVDYLTPFSGITPEMMKNVTKTLAEVQADIRKLLPADAILVGQSLHSDLMAMRMMHPYVIDTSVIFNISGDRRRKSKLQTLAHEFLGEAIQKNPLGHDSIEDCSASLKLTKLKLQRGIDFGDAILANSRRVNERNRNESTSSETSNLSKPAAVAASTAASTSTNKMDRSTAVITANDEFTEAYERTVKDKIDDNQAADKKVHIYKNASNKIAVQKTCEVALNHALTLTHLNIESSKLVNEKVEKTMKKVDKWIENLWNSAAPNALFVVVFSGQYSPDSSSTGAAMLQIKSKA
ncbi:RNA exonuclease 5 isoform X2 [Sitodiplosis mosellana]|uniref:RNA exonuclease 5 isoform X2 n=1 Tax=Sitodiplosis mosellana TaxID=263140 RepID=UPI002444D767|nr:RNA exonuclease 5 isoform X2 [Sitodiplosis mosellana]XP_055315279.1 RNA exonuclease 5 isoform X2 [Sitodiplosis mosellana]